jgi:transcriptional regulator with XRE-family HTH domain
MKQFNNIRRFREFKGYSQKYVARKLGKSQPAFSKIENGITQVSNNIVEQLSEILEAPKEKLFTDEPLIIHNKNSSQQEHANNKKFSPAKKGSVSPLNTIAPFLFNQLAENKKLLHKVQSNQEEVLQLLNLILMDESKKK